MKRLFCLLAAALATVSCVVETYDKPLETDPGWQAAGHAVRDMVRNVSAADLVRILAMWNDDMPQQEQDAFCNRYFQGRAVCKAGDTIEVAGLCRIDTHGVKPGRYTPWAVVFEPGTAFGDMPYHIHCESDGMYSIGDASGRKGFYAVLPSTGRCILSGKNSRYRMESGSFPGFYAYDAWSVIFVGSSDRYDRGWPLQLQPVGGSLSIERYVRLEGEREEFFDPEFGRVTCIFQPEGEVEVDWRGFSHRYTYLP